MSQNDSEIIGNATKSNHINQKINEELNTDTNKKPKCENGC